MDSVFDQTLQQALQATRRHDAPQARHLLAEAMRMKPESPLPFFLLAAEHAAQGETDLAEAAYINTLQRAPELAIARFQLGLLRLSTGRPHSAIATWAPLTTLAESDTLRLFSTGLIQWALGKPSDAIPWLQKGVAANTSLPPLNADMQRILDQITATGTPVTSTANRKTEPETSSQEESVEHFLVSSYRHLH